MTSPLPPHLQQFVRQQLAQGRFRSEGEILHAALTLLAEQPPPRESPETWRRRGTGHGLHHDLLEPAQGQQGSQPVRPEVRRSPRGILGDLSSDLSFDDLHEARREMWSDFSHDAW